MSKLTANFHVQNQDYFGTLATVLCLIRQSQKEDSISSVVLEITEKDLMYLQENFNIVPKQD
jgi:hypothetical protein